MALAPHLNDMTKRTILIYSLFIVAVLSSFALYKSVVMVVVHNSPELEGIIEGNVIGSYALAGKLKFKLSLKNNSKDSRVVLLNNSTIYLSNGKSTYPVYIDAFLGDTKTVEKCLEAGQLDVFDLYSPVEIFTLEDSYNFHITKEIISPVPICINNLKDMVDGLSSIKVRSKSYNGSNEMISIGYILECVSRKEYFISFSSDGRVKVRDTELKKQILDFKRENIIEYLNDICGM